MVRNLNLLVGIAGFGGTELGLWGRSVDTFFSVRTFLYGVQMDFVARVESMGYK